MYFFYFIFRTYAGTLVRIVRTFMFFFRCCGLSYGIVFLPSFGTGMKRYRLFGKRETLIILWFNQGIIVSS